MKLEPAQRAAALAAIRAAGGELADPIDAWAAGSPARRQVFVTAQPAPLARGEPYDTWVVTFAADGSAISVERFSSTACRSS